MNTMKYKRTFFLAVIFFLVMGFFSCDRQQKIPGKEEVIKAYNLSVPKSKLSKTLHVFIYPLYSDPRLLETFEEVYGVKVIMDYYDTNEVMIAKLQAGGLGQYDLIFPSDYAVTILKKKNLLEALDKNNIPNLANLEPKFRKLPFDPGNDYSVCYQWGTTGIGVRTDLVDIKNKEIDTWKILFDPAAQLGSFVMLDDPRETIGTALKYLGYSINTTEEKELKEAEALLISQKQRVMAYASSSTARDLLVSGDAAVSHNFSGDVFAARAELGKIEYVIPREGAIIWADNMAIPAQAPHKYTAEVFINFILDARNGAQLTNYIRYSSPNKAALSHILPEIRENPGLYPGNETLKRLEFIRDVGEAAKLYDDVWTRVKAASK